MTTETRTTTHPRTYEYEAVINPRLKEYRVREITPRTCAFCVHLIEAKNKFGEGLGIGQCERPNGPSFDYSEMEQFCHGCRGWKGY